MAPDVLCAESVCDVIQKWTKNCRADRRRMMSTLMMKMKMMITKLIEQTLQLKR